MAVFYTDTVDLGGHDFYFYYQMIVQGSTVEIGQWHMFTLDFVELLFLRLAVFLVCSFMCRCEECN